VTFLQETYGITVVDEELLPENLDSIDAATTFVSRKLDGTAPGHPAAASRATFGGPA
jgi:hypothetical protein